MPRIFYDDRKKFPWVVAVGPMIWASYLTHESALKCKVRLDQVISLVQGQRHERPKA